MSEPFDESAKQFYSRLFSQWGLMVETEREVFHRGRTIDLVVDCPAEARVQMAQTAFSHFRQQNAVELKGNHDPLTLTDYNRTMGRAWTLGGLVVKKNDATDETTSVPTAQQVVRHPAERTLTIICVNRPNTVLNDERLAFQQTDAAGIYQHDGQLPVWIIHPSGLALEPQNYPLLVLAKGKKLEAFIKLCFNEGLTDYLQLILDVGLAVDPDTIWQKIMEAYNMTIQLREETWPYIDRFLYEAPEAVQKLSFFREAIETQGRIREEIGLQKGQEIGLQKGQEIGLQKGQEIGLQKGQEIGLQKGQEIGALHNQKRLLIRQLRRKFPNTPARVIERIQATPSIQTLDQWLDQVFEADTLADLDLFDDKMIV